VLLVNVHADIQDIPICSMHIPLERGWVCGTQAGILDR
jgi:hypothetical protein